MTRTNDSAYIHTMEMLVVFHRTYMPVVPLLLFFSQASTHIWINNFFFYFKNVKDQMYWSLILFCIGLKDVVTLKYCFDSHTDNVHSYYQIVFIYLFLQVLWTCGIQARAAWSRNAGGDPGQRKRPRGNLRGENLGGTQEDAGGTSCGSPAWAYL